MPAYIKETEDGIYLSIHVIPGSKKTQISGLHGDKLKIKVKSPPVEGKANSEIIGFFVKLLNLKKQDVEIVKGLKSRQKVIFLKGCSRDSIISIIED